jgi:hypothetical protein
MLSKLGMLFLMMQLQKVHRWGLFFNVELQVGFLSRFGGVSDLGVYQY